MEANLDGKTLHQLEQELHTEILPGTELMADVGSVHFVKSNNSEQVLVPQPSNDPHDPLNWSPFWKFSAIMCASLVSFAQAFGPLALAPMFPQLIEQFHSNLADVIQFTGVCILVLGFSNFIWVPISSTFGRRPVLIFSCLICMGSMIWRAEAKTYGQFMAASVLNGIGAGPAETMQPTVVADTIFLHERGRYNTLYFVVYFGGIMVGPIVSGPMASSVGPRAFWWLNVALLGGCALVVFVAFPETKWNRLHPDEARTLASRDPKVNVQGVEMESMAEGAPDVEKNVPNAERDQLVGKGTPSRSQFGLFASTPRFFRALVVDFFTPWWLFFFPIVEFASFVVSWSASAFLTLNLTQSQVFAAPPYNFSTNSVGYTNFAIVVGGLIGLATAGPLSDWLSMRATIRNKGVREPEMRLPTMIPYVIIMIIGNFVVAFGYEHHWDWKVIVFIGYTAAGIQVAALPAIVSTYAVDSYKPVAGSIFVAITVNKNVWGYGFSKFITPWSVRDGFIPVIMLNMCLITLWCSFGIVFYYYGKTFRRWTRNSKVHQM